MIRNSILLSLLIVFGLGLTGCGVYTFNPRGQSDYNAIAIEPFENKTSEYGLAERITETVVDAFIADGSVKIVPAAGADALLEGILTSYRRVVEKYDESDQVEQYKIVMEFEITLKNPDDETDIWSERMVQEGVYDASEEVEEDGQRRASERLVDAVLNKTTKSW